MARMDNVAITAWAMAIWFLALSFARTAMLELRTVLDGPAERAGCKARAGAWGAARRGAARGVGHQGARWGDESGDSRRTW